MEAIEGGSCSQKRQLYSCEAFFSAQLSFLKSRNSIKNLSKEHVRFSSVQSPAVFFSVRQQVFAVNPEHSSFVFLRNFFQHQTFNFQQRRKKTGQFFQIQFGRKIESSSEPLDDEARFRFWNRKMDKIVFCSQIRMAARWRPIDVNRRVGDFDRVLVDS